MNRGDAEALAEEEAALIDYLLANVPDNRAVNRAVRSELAGLQAEIDDRLRSLKAEIRAVSSASAASASPPKSLLPENPTNATAGNKSHPVENRRGISKSLQFLIAMAGLETLVIIAVLYDVLKPHL